jgi:acyl-coenzyme A thioesterase PaaI-like protein
MEMNAKGNDKGMALHAGGQEFLAMTGQSWKFRFFMFQKLPAAYFSGVRVREIGPEYARVSVPYTWFSQNPFRSTYFACLSMAAEMSTGLLGMMQVHGRKPAVSMLVVKIEGEFLKKATGITTFTCKDGAVIAQAVEQTLATGDPVIVRSESIGLNDAGEVVAVFHVTWSFRAKMSKS